MSFETVYITTTEGYFNTVYILLCINFLFLLFSIVLFIVIWKYRFAKIFLSFPVSIFFASIIFSLIGTLPSYYEGIECQNALASGNFKVVEGPINEFHPMPRGGHAYEILKIGEKTFSYSKYEGHWCGFNRRNQDDYFPQLGDYLRIFYIEDRIIKIEKQISVK